MVEIAPTTSLEGGYSLSPLIERSWSRSSACGVRQGLDGDLPYSEDFDNDSRLIRAAQPVLERLVASLSETHHSVLLADREGRLIQRWVGMKSLHNRLDRASIAPGFAFTEEFAGTNGVGTALEEDEVVAVRGDEHYVESLRGFACVGVPIHHPFRGTVEGVLDFTCRSADYHSLIRPLLVESVKHIETRFSQQASAAESALLECFVRTCRASRAAVVALRPNMFLTNGAAAKLLSPSDQAVLWDVAVTVNARGGSEGSVDLSGGRYGLRLTAVDSGSQSVGLVIRLAPERTADPTVVPGVAVTPDAREGVPVLPGRTVQWRRVRTRLAELADHDLPVAVTGESGTGKMLVARHLHRCSSVRTGLRVFDGGAETRDGGTQLLGRCRETLAQGDTAIICRMDRLPPRAAIELSELVRRTPRPARLVVTCNDDAPEAIERALAAFPDQLWLPPLRQRSEDIADIVPALLAELAPDRVLTCAPAALQTLMRHAWPGNTAELRDVLGAASGAAVAGWIEVVHLPPWLRKRAHRRRFSPLELSERDLIIETLASVDNNRTEAAKVLGMGRATLYRRLRSLGIAVGDELAE